VCVCVCVCERDKERETERQRDRERDRETKRQRDRETKRQRDRNKKEIDRECCMFGNRIYRSAAHFSLDIATSICQTLKKQILFIIF